MLNIVKSILSPKVGVGIILRGSVSIPEGNNIQKLVRYAGLAGWMRVAPGRSHAAPA